MVIRKISPNITTLSAPFARFGKLKIGGRGTLVRLTSGALAVFSPVALTPEVRETIASLGGNLRYITAPDIEHHIFLGPWHAAYPDAKVIGPEGLPEKRALQKNEAVPFSYIFTAANKADFKIDPDFDQDFEYEYVSSHPGKELVFYYKPERTLIEADLMFNLPATEQYSRYGESPTSGILTKLFVAVNKTSGSAIWHKRLQWYGASSKDRAGFNASIQRIAKWDFDTIVLCHGDTIQGGAKGIFEKIFEWHLQGKK
jgi:hypothetical protein